MSWQATAWVIEKSKHKGSALLTLLCIANCANETGTDAFPGLPRLAKDTRMSLRQVGRIVEKLGASGELIVRRVEGRVHHYSLPLMTPAKMSGVRKWATPDKSALTPDILGATPDIAMSPDPSIRTINQNGHSKKLEKPRREEIEPTPPYHGDIFIETLETFKAQRRAKKNAVTPEGLKIIFKKLASVSESEAVDALEDAIAGGYRGVFPKSRNGRNGNNGNGSAPKLSTEERDRKQADLRERMTGARTV